MAEPRDEASESDRHGGPSIVFQPLVDLSAWRVVGFEALARFPDGVPPAEHLARASHTGRRQQLELELIELAVAASAALPPRALVTINGSGTTLLHPALGRLLAASDAAPGATGPGSSATPGAAASHAAPRTWGLEVYEGATCADLPAIRARATELGARLLLDDGGAGSADEARIRALRPDVVKIDRALFWRLGSDPTAEPRIAALAAAAREVGASLLVEGVSSTEHVELARGLGAELAQGYHLGVPTPPAEIPAMLTELHDAIGLDADQ